MEYRINQLIDHALDAGRITGTVVLICQDGQPVFSRAAGYADREAQKPIEFDTIFRLASVSKPLTAATALAMVERGLLGLSEKVADHLPWFTPKTPDGRIADITIHHLLTHTAGLVYDPALEKLSPDQAITQGLANTDLDFEANFSRHNAQPLNFEPGTRWAYSFATDVLGAVIAKVYGGTLEGAVNKYVTGPLGMKDSRFHVTDLDRLAAAYADSLPNPVRMPDPWLAGVESGWSLAYSPSRIFNPHAFQSGGAGMVGTAPDFMQFLEAIRTGGGNVLKPETVELAFTNQIGALEAGEPGAKFGYLGGLIDDPALTGTPHSPGTLQWGGVYGHNWFIDRSKNLSVLSFSNNAIEGCMGEFPRRITEAVYGV
jgi:CubicO group peptidase (beta-lactamase class C family)